MECADYPSLSCCDGLDDSSSHHDISSSNDSEEEEYFQPHATDEVRIVPIYFCVRC